MALGEVAALFLEQVAGIRTVSHVISIGGAGVESDNTPLPGPDDVAALDASPVRTLDKDAEERMVARIDEAKAKADTLGGVIEVIAYGVPAGIGTYVGSDRRLDAALGGAGMGIQAIKDSWRLAAPVPWHMMRWCQAMMAALHACRIVPAASRAVCPTGSRFGCARP